MRGRERAGAKKKSKGKESDSSGDRFPGNGDDSYGAARDWFNLFCCCEGARRPLYLERKAKKKKREKEVGWLGRRIMEYLKEIQNKERKKD